MFYDKYDIVKELGKGKYSRVFEIVDKEDKKYAVKLLKIKSCSLYKSVPKEAIFLERVKDIPTVVKYYEYFNDIQYLGESYLGIVTEKIEGYSLKGLWKSIKQKGKSMEISFLYNFCDFMINTLVSLHKMNIVHRDIKLENIIVVDKQSFKLVDFGFAGYIISSARDLRAQGRAGTPYYMPPELLVNGEVTPETVKSADVWAFGITLYALSNMYLPFDGTDIASFCLKLEKNDRNDSYCSDENINKLVEMCLEHNYRSRPSAKNLLDFFNQNLVK